MYSRTILSFPPCYLCIIIHSRSSSTPRERPTAHGRGSRTQIRRLFAFHVSVWRSVIYTQLWYRPDFSTMPERLSGVTEVCVPACGNGVLESRKRLFRTKERTGAPEEWVRMRFLYGFSAFAFPVSRFCFVKIFYCLNRIFMHSGMHRAIAITSLPAQWRMPSRDAKCCVSRATNSAMTGI